MIYDGTGSVEGGTGWYSVVLGQNRAVLVASMMSFQKIYGLHGLNHQIIVVEIIFPASLGYEESVDMLGFKIGP